MARSSVRRKKPAKGDQPERSRVLRFIDRAGLPELLIFGLMIGIGGWSWLSYVVAQPQNFTVFAGIFFGATILGSTVQIIFFALIRPPGSFRRRASFRSLGASKSGTEFLIYSVPVCYLLIFLMVTPPSTPGDGFDPGMSIYRVMLIMALLSLAASISGFVVYGLVILPFLWILAGVLPTRSAAEERRRYDAVSRGEFITGGLLLIAITVFGISMYFVNPDATDNNHSRMGAQLAALVTLRGNAVASALVLICVTAIVVLIILHNRFAARRREDHMRKRQVANPT